MRTGADGLALVFRGGDVAASLGLGGGSLGYGGLEGAVAVEIDTWPNDEMGDMIYSHVSVQAGGPHGAVGAHAEQTLASAMLPTEVYPHGIADGAAHVLRVRYSPGLQMDMLSDGPPATVCSGTSRNV